MKTERFPLQRSRITKTCVTIVGNAIEVPFAQREFRFCVHKTFPGHTDMSACTASPIADPRPKYEERGWVERFRKLRQPISFVFRQCYCIYIRDLRKGSFRELHFDLSAVCIFCIPAISGGTSTLGRTVGQRGKSVAVFIGPP